MTSSIVCVKLNYFSYFVSMASSGPEPMNENRNINLRYAAYNCSDWLKFFEEPITKLHMSLA